MKKLAIAAGVTLGTIVLVAGGQQLAHRPDYWPDVLPGKPAVQEWYSDIPWHQKLGTFNGNEIDQGIIMPFVAMAPAEQSYCTSKGWTGDNVGRCMIEVGVNNIIGVLRTDSLYDPKAPLIKAATYCTKDTPC